MSRLKKVHLADDAAAAPMRILVPDFEEKIVNKDKIQDITYGPSNQKQWVFEEPIDNPEWGLRSSFTKKI